MGVHISCQLGGGEVPQLRQRQLGQEFTDFAAHQMRSQKLAMRLVGNYFDETAAFTQSVGLGAGLHREDGDPYAVTGGASLLFGEAEVATWGWQNVTRGIIR